MNLKLKLTLVFLAVLSQNVKSEVDVTVNKKEIVVREGKEIDLICSLQVNNFQGVSFYIYHSIPNMFYKQPVKNWTTYKFQYVLRQCCLCTLLIFQRKLECNSILVFLK